jgi:membrane protein DedA with SNARE-associated domain
MPPLSDELSLLIITYGCWFVATIIALESMGLPLPGEAALVIAALYAGTTHNLDIVAVVAAAAAGAVIGDNVGFWIGRHVGYPLALRYGGYIGLNAGRIKLGQYLFLLHGGKVVFFGRFFALLRVLAAFLAGTNRMPFRRFVFYNISGGIVWAMVFGFGSYLMGDQVQRLFGALGVVGMVVALVLGLIIVTVFLRHHEVRLQEEAERALPDEE